MAVIGNIFDPLGFADRTYGVGTTAAEVSRSITGRLGQAACRFHEGSPNWWRKIPASAFLQGLWDGLCQNSDGVGYQAQGREFTGGGGCPGVAYRPWGQLKRPNGTVEPLIAQSNQDFYLPGLEFFLSYNDAINAYEIVMRGSRQDGTPFQEIGTGGQDVSYRQASLLNKSWVRVDGQPDVCPEFSPGFPDDLPVVPPGFPTTPVPPPPGVPGPGLDFSPTVVVPVFRPTLDIGGVNVDIPVGIEVSVNQGDTYAIDINGDVLSGGRDELLERNGAIAQLCDSGSGESQLIALSGVDCEGQALGGAVVASGSGDQLLKGAVEALNEMNQRRQTALCPMDDPPPQVERAEVFSGVADGLNQVLTSGPLPPDIVYLEVVIDAFGEDTPLYRRGPGGVDQGRFAQVSVGTGNLSPFPVFDAAQDQHWTRGCYFVPEAYRSDPRIRLAVRAGTSFTVYDMGVRV